MGALRTSSTGETRYYWQVGTTTVNTTTGVTLSQTQAEGALYHAIQVDVLTTDTSASTHTWKLQGSLDENTGTNYFDIVGTTITAAGS